MPSGIYVRTAEYRETMREVALANGYGSWMKGRPADPRRLKSMAEANTGSNHWNWKGGISHVPGYKLHLNAQRRALKMNAPGSHTFEEWQWLKTLVDDRCVACGKQEPEVTLTRDHIIPLTMGGSDNITNIQPLCKSCNSSKSASIADYLYDM